MARYKKIKAATSININDSEELDFDERLIEVCNHLLIRQLKTYKTQNMPTIRQIILLSERTFADKWVALSNDCIYKKYGLNQGQT
ncbi:hypothetical protein [Mucilaginibacter sp. 44-25]|uniref:hypothetical protein n=1 Tax=Mucilaginibacter sp. 44-25 TaxID=1895794 RepID=UPI0009633F0F|nr:hypothetical protein [Mucilaginibacter sp. 44-25]OJW17303.1 MAG: hypothetical protein BGO48_07030 [Mucilaginibacter sp. 44-25]